MIIPNAAYITLIVLALMCAVVTWKARWHFLKDPTSALIPTIIFINIALENAYYFYARLIDDGTVRSEIMWFLPGVLAFKVIYICCLARLILDRNHDACKEER